MATAKKAAPAKKVAAKKAAPVKKAVPAKETAAAAQARCFPERFLKINVNGLTNGVVGA
jgi:hypothetical protein